MTFKLRSEECEGGRRKSGSRSFLPLISLRSCAETGRGGAVEEKSGLGASCLQAQAQREAHGTQLRASDNRHLPLDGKEEADGCLGCYTDLSQRPLRVGSNLDEGSVSYEKCLAIVVLSCPSLRIGQPATTFVVEDAGVRREKPQPQLPLSWKPWLGGKQHGLRARQSWMQIPAPPLPPSMPGYSTHLGLSFSLCKVGTTQPSSWCCELSNNI